MCVCPSVLGHTRSGGLASVESPILVHTGIRPSKITKSLLCVGGSCFEPSNMGMRAGSWRLFGPLALDHTRSGVRPPLNHLFWSALGYSSQEHQNGSSLRVSPFVLEHTRSGGPASVVSPILAHTGIRPQKNKMKKGKCFFCEWAARVLCSKLGIAN